MIKYITLLIFCCLSMLSYADSPKQNASQVASLNQESSIKQLVTHESTTIKTTSRDKFENYNRNAYRMNDKIDKIVVRPTAIGYVTYVPSPIRTVLSNFFNNLRDFVTLGNDILQLNGQSSMKNLMRISINTTLGLVGILDISSSIGLVQNKNSFGNTMKVYGWSNSSYYVIPLLGPSTVRDTIGLIPDTVLNPTWFLINNNYISVGLFVINSINTRTQFLGFDQILNASIDPYITMRDTYLATIGEIPTTNKDIESEPSIDFILENDTSPPTDTLPIKTVPTETLPKN